MRFNEYLSGLPADAQPAIPNALTRGAGWAAVAARRHTANDSAIVVLGTLATAWAALRSALEGLGEHYEAATAPPAVPTDNGLPAHWTELVARAGAESIGVWLQMAAEMARDAAVAARRDADVAIVRDLLRDALDTLTTVRNDALSAV